MDTNISNALRKRLEDAGLTSLEELKKRNIIQLTQEFDLTEDEISIIASLLHEKDQHRSGTAAASLVQRRGITTSCQRLDQLLPATNGIPKGGITELSGGPGSGKTQFCIQLALNVQLPESKGGFDGDCIYIDTVGGLMAERFSQVARANNKDGDGIQDQLKHITHFRVLELVEMMALIRQLPILLQESTKVKLLIVDSIAYHLRLNIRDNRIRVGLVNHIGQTLVQIAHQFNVAIVVTNCISMDRMFSSWRPALGDSWAQWCTHRLMLTRKRQQRYATLYNAPQQTSKTMAPFCITETGIEDVDTETLEQLYQWQESEEPEQVKESPLQGLVEPTDWVNGYDEDIWDEPSGFMGTFDKSVMQEENQILAPDSQPDYSYMDQLRQQQQENMIDTSAHPPLAAYNRYHPGRKRRPASPSNESRHKTPRQTMTENNPDDNKEHDQSADEWGPDNDDLWLSIAAMSSPSL